MFAGSRARCGLCSSCPRCWRTCCRSLSLLQVDWSSPLLIFYVDSILVSYLVIRKEGKGLSPSLRAAQLYESVRIRPVVVEEAVVGVMPQEAKSTKSKTMSYEVNPESCHI